VISLDQNQAGKQMLERIVAMLIKLCSCFQGVKEAVTDDYYGIDSFECEYEYEYDISELNFSEGAKFRY